MTALGQKHSPESIEKMRRSALGKVISAETRSKISAANAGVPKSEEWKRKKREWWDDHRKWSSHREMRLSHLGLTLEGYDTMYEAQQGLCTVCAVWFAQLSVDHDHETGKVRGLVCGPCNLVLGHLEKWLGSGSLERALAHLGAL